MQREEKRPLFETTADDIILMIIGFWTGLDATNGPAFGGRNELSAMRSFRTDG